MKQYYLNEVYVGTLYLPFSTFIFISTIALIKGGML